MIACPNCQIRTISAWRKQFIGPLRKIRCPDCKAQISVSWPQSILLGFIAWLLPVVWFVTLVEGGVLLGVFVALVTLILVGLYQHHLVPLTVRSLPEE